MTTMDYLNPWNAANCIQDYNFYCCPECVYRSKSEGDFQIHATCNHPESKVFFDRLEGRIDPISVKSEQVVVEYDAKVLEHLKTDNDLEDELEPQKPDLIDQPRVHPVNFQPNALYAVFSGEKFSGIVQKVDSELLEDELKKEEQKKSLKAMKKLDTPKVPDSYKCKCCESVFEAKKDLIAHLKSEHDLPKIRELYKCQSCEETFTRMTVLESHLRSAHNTSLYTCDLCLPNRRFYNKSRQNKHIKRFHNTELIPCTHCGKMFTEYGMRHHMRKEHDEKPEKKFNCDQCPFATHSHDSLKSHKLNIHDETSKKFECEKCHKKFRFPYKLKEHVCHGELEGERNRTCGPRKTVTCLECGVEVGGPQGLANHYRVTHKKLPPGHRAKGKEPLICDQCSDIFITEDALTNHINNKHSHPEERQCPECGKEFSGLLYLSQHYKAIHGGVLPSMVDRETFLCDQCPSVFFAKGSLQWHQNQHHLKLTDPKRTTAKRKQCPHCPKTFIAQITYTEHIRSKHEMNTPYKCDQCHRSYGTKLRLEAHKTNVHKRVKCNICQQGICNSFMLKRHKASVHGVIPKNVFRCDHCPLFFAKIVSKESHVRTHHPDTLASEEPNV